MRPFFRDQLDTQILDHIIDDKNTEFVHFLRLVSAQSFAQHLSVKKFHDT